MKGGEVLEKLKIEKTSGYIVMFYNYDKDIPDWNEYPELEEVHKFIDVCKSMYAGDNLEFRIICPNAMEIVEGGE
jgi:hypothetical protein